MKTSAEIREAMGREFDRVQAILDVAKTEDRELTADENTEIDTINGCGEGKEFKPGTIDKMKGDLARVEKIEARAAELSAKRPSATKPQSGDGGGDVDEEDDANNFTKRLAKVRVPASARYRHTDLKAFKPKSARGAELFAGDQGEKAAYVSGMFVLATVGKSEPARKWCSENGVPIKFRGALQESDNSLGGFLVPQEMERAIINLREERGVLRREAMVVPMGSDTMILPRRTAGVTAYFVNEGAAPTASSPTLDQVQLAAKKLMTLTAMSSEIAEDAVISVGDWLTSEIAYAMADKEDSCGFLGDGTSTYGHITGVKNALAAGSVYTATGHAEFSALTLADFHGMTAKLPFYAQQNAKWFVSKAGFNSSMERLMAAGGGNTWSTLADGSPGGPRFLGYDVVFTQVMNSALTGNTGVTGGIFFGDLRMSVALGSRRGLSIDASPHFYFSQDQIAIRGAERFDVNVHEIGTSTASGALVSLTFG